jgi:hypothetical protein
VGTGTAAFALFLDLVFFCASAATTPESSESLWLGNLAAFFVTAGSVLSETRAWILPLVDPTDLTVELRIGCSRTFFGRLKDLPTDEQSARSTALSSNVTTGEDLCAYLLPFPMMSKNALQMKIIK